MAKFNMYLMLSAMISIMAKGVALHEVEIFVNDSVSMKCSLNGTIDIQWHFNTPYNYVYAGGILRYPYDSRFRLDSNETTGKYDLIIPKVTLQDAGMYMCSEEISGRRINSTQLIVLYMKPVCSSNMHTDGFIGPNTCEIQQENMMFNCDVVFNGRPPNLSWRSANDSQVFNSSSCEVKSNRRSCSLTLRADPSYDGSVFRCDVGQIKLDDQRYNCNTERIKVHYFVGGYGYADTYVHESASCMVRSNLNVRYNWTLKQDNEEIFLTSKQTVSIEKPGLHRCEVEYSIRNVTCSLLVSDVNATVYIARTEARKGQSTNTLLALAITLPIAFLVIVALIGLVIYILRRKSKYFPVNMEEPLQDFHLDAIKNCRETLLELIDTSQLLDLLEKNGVFDKARLDYISSKSTSREKNEAFLDILGNGNLLSYWLTIRCLRQSNQSDAAEKLETGGWVKVKMNEPLTEREIEAIENSRETLLELIDTSQLLDLLEKNGVFDKTQLDSISSKSTSREKNEALLEILRNGNLFSYWLTIRCLRQSNQSDAVNILESGGWVKIKMDEPLTEKEHLAIENSRETLLELIDTSQLLDLFEKNDVFDKTQLDSISSKSTSREKNEALLEIIKDGNLLSYWLTIRCLHQSNQSDAAERLETGGWAKVKMNEPLTEREIKAIENSRETLLELIDTSQLLDLLEKNGVFDKTQLDSISSKSTSREKNEALLEIIKDGNLLSYWLTIRCLRQSNQSDAAERLETGGYIKDSWIPKLSISDLPLEVVDIILQESCLLSIARQWNSENRKDDVTIKLLGSVNFCWFKRIRKKYFKNVVWSKLKTYYEDKHKHYIVYKNNRQFFEEVLQTSGKSPKDLQKENKCFRTAFLTAKKAGNVVKACVRSFDPKERELIGKLMNTGGSAARVEIQLSRLSTLTEFELILQQFEDEKMKILIILKDREAVVWIWCRANSALQKLNNRDQSKNLIENACQSEEETSYVLEHRTNIDYDQLKKKLDLLRKMSLDFRTKLSFDRKAEGRENRGIRKKRANQNKKSNKIRHFNLSEEFSDLAEVIDVTKLKKNIYVLCKIRDLDREGNPLISTTICIFEGPDPYPLVRRFDEPNAYGEFRSIVSSYKQNCLYLLGSDFKIANYVEEVIIRFEIKEDDGEDCNTILYGSLQHHTMWLKFEGSYHPSGLSISRDGNLIMVDSSSPIILKIYDSDATLQLCVSLHGDILVTQKAVQASNGNFIILHSMKRQTEDADNCDRAKETYEVDRDFMWTVSELSRDGKTIIRRFIPQNQEPQFDFPSSFNGGDLFTDSEGRVFVAEPGSDRLIVLDSFLRWIGILHTQFKNWDRMKKLQWTLKLVYDKISHLVIVTRKDEVHIYDLIRK